MFKIKSRKDKTIFYIQRFILELQIFRVIIAKKNNISILWKWEI